MLLFLTFKKKIQFAVCSIKNLLFNQANTIKPSWYQVDLKKKQNFYYNKYIRPSWNVRIEQTYIYDFKILMYVHFCWFYASYIRVVLLKIIARSCTIKENLWFKDKQELQIVICGRYVRRCFCAKAFISLK